MIRLLNLSLLIVALTVMHGGFLGASEDFDVTAIKGAKIRTLSGPDIEDGIIIIKGKLISKITTDSAEIPEGSTIVSARGKFIVPGYIDSYTYIGLVEVQAVEMTRDMEDVEIVAPDLWTGDAYNGQSELIRVARVNGITTVLSAPAFTNIMPGRSILVNLLDALDVDDITVKKYAALHINIGSSPTKKKDIMTRMGVLAKAREAFVDAREYQKKKEEYAAKLRKYQEKLISATDEEKKKLKEPNEPAVKLDKEVLVQVLNKELPAIIHVNRADDILRAIKLSEEFDFRIILAGCAEIWKVADEVARAKIPVILGPINTQPSGADTLYVSYQNARLLYEKGIKFSIATFNDHMVMNLPYMAGLAAAYGLPPEEALKAITLYPAQIFGVEDKVGSIKEGAYANFLIFDNDPLDPAGNMDGFLMNDPLQPLAKLEAVYIQGEKIPFDNHHIRLYEQYK